MALVPCRECRREVSTEAVSCPHCGVTDPSGAAAAAAAAARETARAAAGDKDHAVRIGIGVVAILVIVGLAIGGSDDRPAGRFEPSPPRVDSLRMARREASERVLRGLTNESVRGLPDSTIRIALAGSVAPELEPQRALVLAESGRRADSVTAHRNRRLEALKRRFVFKRDEIEGSGWYTHRSQTVDNSWNRTYLKVHVSEHGHAYLASEYTGDDWIFHERVVVRIADRILRSEVIPGYSDLNYRHNSGGTVWETLHFTGGKDNGIMAAIAEAGGQAIRVRLEGDQYSKDFVLSARDQRAIQEGVELGRLLRGE